MSARCRRLPRRRVQTRVRCPGRRERRWSACLRRQPARRCSGRRSSAGRRRRARGLGEWNQRPAVASSVHLSMIIRWISLVPSKIVKIVDERSVSAGQRRVWGCGISTDPAPDFGGRRRLPAARICCRARGVAQEGAANPWYQPSAEYCAEVHRRYIVADLPAHAPRAAMAHGRAAHGPNAEECPWNPAGRCRPDTAASRAGQAVSRQWRQARHRDVSSTVVPGARTLCGGCQSHFPNSPRCYRPRYLNIQRLNYLWTIRHSSAWIQAT
jgi:hypothetical protein